MKTQIRFTLLGVIVILVGWGLRIGQVRGLDGAGAAITAAWVSPTLADNSNVPVAENQTLAFTTTDEDRHCIEGASLPFSAAVSWSVSSNRPGDTFSSWNGVTAAQADAPGSTTWKSVATGESTATVSLFDHLASGQPGFDATGVVLTRTFKWIGIERIEYPSGTTLGPGPLIIPVGSSGQTIGLIAIPKGGSQFPAGKPTWSGGSLSGVTGDTANIPIGSPGTTSYTAACGGVGGVSGEIAKTVTVSVVKAAKVQFNDPDSGWIDCPGTLYVFKDTTVSFRAIKDDGSTGSTSWPTGKPVWSGTAGATGGGDTKDINFTALGSKTVTIECGNTVAASIVVYDLVGWFAPQDYFAGRSYSRFGVGELVDLSFTTADATVSASQAGGLTWSISAGPGTLSSVSAGEGTAQFDAPGEAAVDQSTTVEFKLKVDSGPSKGKFRTWTKTITPPTGAHVIQKPDTIVGHAQGIPSVGFLAWSYLLPKDVSFSNCQFSEGEPPDDDHGWFLAKYPANDDHKHAEDNPITISGGNISTGCRIIGTDEVASTASAPPTIDDGWYEWNIPWRIRIAGATDYEWWEFMTVTQHIDLGANGTMVIQKHDAGPFDKQLNAASSNYVP